MNLKNKTKVITGGTDGLGLALAREHSHFGLEDLTQVKVIVTPKK